MPQAVEHNRFKVTLSVTKAYEAHDLASVDATPKRRIVGMATGIKMDRDGERMARSVIEQFREAIKTGIILDSGEWSLIPLISAHRKNALGEPEWDQILGHLVDAWIDDEWNLWIEAELDPFNPAADLLYRKLTINPEEGKPARLGLSIGGRVIDARMEYDRELGRDVLTYYLIALSEVSVTSAPSVPTTYLTAISKSVRMDKLQDKDNDMEDNTPIVNAIDEDVEKELSEVAEVETAPDAEADVEKQVEADAETDADEVTKEIEEDVADEIVEREVSEVEDVVEVEKEVADEATEPFVTLAKFDALSAAVQKMADSLNTFMEVVQKSVALPIEDAEEVIETEPEAVVEEVAVAEKSVEATEESVADVILKALSAQQEAFDQKLADVTKAFTAKLDELANEEVDKSITVSRASDVTKSLLRENETSDFELRLNESKGADAIRLALTRE